MNWCIQTLLRLLLLLAIHSFRENTSWNRRLSWTNRLCFCCCSSSFFNVCSFNHEIPGNNNIAVACYLIRNLIFRVHRFLHDFIHRVFVIYQYFREVTVSKCESISVFTKTHISRCLLSWICSFCLIFLEGNLL